MCLNDTRWLSRIPLRLSEQLLGIRVPSRVHTKSETLVRERERERERERTSFCENVGLYGTGWHRNLKDNREWRATSGGGSKILRCRDDDDVYYYSFYLNCIGQRLKLEGKTENTGVCTKEQEGMTAGVLMATPCIKLKMMKMMFITISARD